jgi:TRAP-type transport system small permease protein
MEKVVRLVDRIVDGLATVAGALMVALTVVVMAAVVSRYALEIPIRTTTELSGVIFAWLVFLAAISVTHNQDNIAVTYFRDKLPGPLPAISEVTMKIVMMVFSAVLAWSSLQLTTAVMDQRLPVLQISSAWLNGSVAVAFTLISLVLLLQIVTDIFFRHLRKPVGESIDPMDPDAGQIGGGSQ